VRGMVSVALQGRQHQLDPDEGFLLMCSSATSATSHVYSAGARPVRII
jgi:hypothetical protein